MTHGVNTSPLFIDTVLHCNEGMLIDMIQMEWRADKIQLEVEIA